MDKSMGYESGTAALFAGHVRSEARWEELYAAWLWKMPTKKAKRRSELTMEAYLGDARQFAAWSAQVNGEAFDPALLNSMDVTAFFKQLAAEGKPATYNRKLASMRMLVAWAREDAGLAFDPTAWIPSLDATRESPRDVQAEEWEKLERAAESGVHLARANDLLALRDLLIFRLLGSAGLRIHEVVGVRLDDLHLDEGYIHVLGKGGKHRKVRVGGKLVQVIRAWLAQGPKSLEGTLVTDEDGQAIDRISAWRRFGMIAEQAGVNATPHSMRHTYIYRFMDKYMAGDKGLLPAAIDAVCQQTGDRPEVILQYYTRARESEMRKVAEEM